MNTIEDEIVEAIRLQRNLALDKTLPLYIIDSIFKSEGYKRAEGDIGDTDGWQVSFWCNYSCPGKKRYCLSGFLWYGNYKIETDDEEDTSKKRKEEA